MPEFTELTSVSLSEFVRLNRFAVVHFWAAWNGYDAEMREILASQLPRDLSERVAFGTFDTSPPEHHEVCRQHGILSLPFLAFYRDGALFRSVAGRRPAEIVSNHLTELVATESR